MGDEIPRGRRRGKGAYIYNIYINIYIYREREREREQMLHCATTGMISAFKWAAMRANFNVSLIVQGKVTRQVSVNFFLSTGAGGVI